VSETVAAIYVRISKIKHRGRRETLGVERQQPPCEEFCERQGWQVYPVVFVDNGVSAVKAKRREHFEEMLSLVRAGKINAIVTWQADRLLRTVEDASAIVAIAREHGTLVANVGGVLDLSTAAGRKKFYDLAVAAQFESELRAERSLLKHDELGQAGQWWGSAWRPFGWQVQGTKLHDRQDERCTRSDDDRCPMVECELLLDEGEAAEIRRQVAAVIERGATYSGIAADWNRRGVLRPGRSRWTARKVSKLLGSPSIAGLRQWKGERYKAEWPAIIDVETFDRLELALANPAPNPHRGRRGPLPRSYLLSGGLAECGNPGCGRPLLPHKGKDRRIYRCESQQGGCGKVSRDAEQVEGYVRDLVLAAFEDPDLGPKLRARLEAKAKGNGVKALLNERETLRAKLRQLEYDYFDDLLDRGQFERGQARVKQRLAQVKVELDAATPQRLPVDLPEGLDALHEAWAEWSIEARRAVIAFALKRVVVKPVGKGYRFDGDRDLVLDWRV
jgi:site-specific DNA recombinase